MLDGDEPIVEMVKQCSEPYHFDFKEYCSSLLLVMEQVNDVPFPMNMTSTLIKVLD